LKALIVGYGLIGRGFAKAVHEKSTIMRKIDKDFEVVGISNSRGFLYDEEGLRLDKLLCLERLSDYSGGYHAGGSPVELIEENAADLIVEATPTRIDNGEPGLTLIRHALSKGIHVITSNKGPLILAFKELTDLAKKNGCELLYEATVAGAVPIFSLVRECLQGDKVIKISGILNGTTNYILSKMYFEETSFEMALKEARERGITERNPSYDIDGIDAACKVLILANAVMNRNAKFENIRIVGINGVTQKAVRLAAKSNFAIKLIGTIDKHLEVAPKLVPINNPLCVNGTLNAIHLETDLAKEITLVGHGAGKETVSAVLNDVLSVLKKKGMLPILGNRRANT
jgi:homoserine dehydrogenase